MGKRKFLTEHDGTDGRTLTEVKLTTTSPLKQLLGVAEKTPGRVLKLQLTVPILALCSLYPPPSGQVPPALLTGSKGRLKRSRRPPACVSIGAARRGLFNLGIELLLDARDVGGQYKLHRLDLGDERGVRLLEGSDRPAHGDQLVLFLVEVLQVGSSAQ